MIQKKNIQLKLNKKRMSSASQSRHQEISLEIPNLHEKYLSGELTPSRTLAKCLEDIRARASNNAWISITPEHTVLSKADTLDQELREHSTDILFRKPLFGIPFAVKDNIDVATLPTSAGCKEFTYTPKETAHAIRRLEEAGAILMGKTNMDQFAAGLVGVRSPFGIPVNPFDPQYCPGGSSSGAGVCVSSGQVSFCIGSDTAGSGRVPASFTNIVGLKPTRGLVSNHGLVPACRSLDCMAIFALTCNDAWTILQSAKGFDESDPYSREEPAQVFTSGLPNRKIRFAVPKGEGLAFFGDVTGARELYASALDRIASTLDCEFVEIDMSPFIEIAHSLYDGPFVAERLAGIEPFFRSHSEALHPITLGIMLKGDAYSAVDTFKAFDQLQALRQTVSQSWKNLSIDFMVVPTCSITPTINEVLEGGYLNSVNAMLGYYNNFVNLLDLSALAVPNGFLPSGMPSAITLIGKAFNDNRLNILGNLFENVSNLPLGATGHSRHSSNAISIAKRAITSPPSSTPIVIVGAHLSGMPLNHQLLNLSATLNKITHTAPCYKLLDVTHSSDSISRPGLIRVAENSGVPIQVEVWNIPNSKLSTFLDSIKPPLALGNITLDDGSIVKGFVSEAYAQLWSKDISHFHGWRNYINNHS